MNRQQTRHSSSVGKSSGQQLPPEDPQVTIRVDKEEYYANEAVTGTVKLKLPRDFPYYVIRLTLIYEEHYVLFNEDGDTALLSKDYKKKLVTNHLLENASEPLLAGEHHIQFGLRMPNKVENGTFYHAGDSLSARIQYKLQAKFIEKQSRNPYKRMASGIDEEKEDIIRTYKAQASIKVCNHFKYVTIQKVLYDESNVSSFLCFGGGITNVEVEYVRDTFCVSPAKLVQRASQSVGGSNNGSIQAIYGGEDEGVDENDSPENIVEARFQIDNTKNRMKIDEILVQLLQIVVLKQGQEKEEEKEEPGKVKRIGKKFEMNDEPEAGGATGQKADEKRFEEIKVLKHVQEVLYEKKCKGYYARDQTEKAKIIKISLPYINKVALKKGTHSGGIYGQLSPQEIKHSRGLQQTTTGIFIENFYMFRVKAILKQDLLNSPYVDNQIFFCYHDVPALDLGEGQLKQMEEAQEQFVKHQEEQNNEGSVQINTRQIEIHHHSDEVQHNFKHFHHDQSNGDAEVDPEQDENSSQDNKV